MKNANNPIIPIYESPNIHESNMGLNKREYFAGLAMQGILANTNYSDLLAGNNRFQDVFTVAELSCRMANELLEQLGDE